MRRIWKGCAQIKEGSSSRRTNSPPCLSPLRCRCAASSPMVCQTTALSPGNRLFPPRSSRAASGASYRSLRTTPAHSSALGTRVCCCASCDAVLGRSRSDPRYSCACAGPSLSAMSGLPADPPARMLAHPRRELYRSPRTPVRIRTSYATPAMYLSARSLAAPHGRCEQLVHHPLRFRKSARTPLRPASRHTGRCRERVGFPVGKSDSLT